MINRHKTIFQNVADARIIVDSPLCVIDPYDLSEDNKDGEATKIDVKEGEWQLFYGLFRDKYDEDQLQLRVCSQRLALEIMKPCKEDHAFFNLVEKGRFSATLPFDADAMDAMAKRATFGYQHVLKLDDALKTKLLRHALSSIFDSRVYSRTSLKVLEAQIRQLPAAEIEPLNAEMINAIISHLENELKIDLDEDVPVSSKVQFIHLKHKDHPIFSPVDFTSWESVGDHYTSSGQVALVPQSWLDSVELSGAVAQIEKLTKQYRPDDENTMRNPMNIKKAGAESYGAACITPERESGNYLYGIRNDAGELVELLIHFDLID